MKRKSTLVKGLSLLLILAVVLTSTSCGTVIYPERRGQAAGRIDASVAALDCVGLLFFLVPGVIAFAVDFATGAIYMPPGSSGYGFNLPVSSLDKSQKVYAESGLLTRRNLEIFLEKETGLGIDLSVPTIKVARDSSEDDLTWSKLSDVLTPKQLAAFESSSSNETL